MEEITGIITAMTTRIKFFLFFVIILGLAVLLFENPFQKQFTQNNNNRFYSNLNKEAISRIEIDYFTNGTKLTKQADGSWQVETLKTELAQQIENSQDKTPASPDPTPTPSVADSDLVDSILSTLTTMPQGDLISSNVDKQAQFQVGKVGLIVRLYNAKEELLHTLHVGKQGPNVFSTFVRDEGSNNIYLVPEGLSELNRPIDSWKKQNNPTQNTQ